MANLIANRYEIIKELGSGGFGRVFLCKDIKLQREVAVKRLNPVSESDLKAKEKFKKEAIRTLDLHHKNIIKVEYFDFDEEGIPYFVMEYLEITLKEILSQKNKLSSEETVKIAINICDALIYAHEEHSESIVHKDIKPENIMFSKNGTVKLCDFGVLKFVNIPDNVLSGTLKLLLIQVTTIKASRS